MKEEMLQIAFSVYKNRGVFALLLGSGVSRAAEIPTGWEVILDLIRKIAKSLDEEIVDEAPAEWYRKKFDEEPRYDDVIERLGNTPAERNSLLRSYFEPTDEQRENGQKLPTQAHKSIARLIKDGYINVVLTTNFDRLLEIALENLGVIPNVISSEDMFQGATPIQHSEITIIKLHGDYLDNRILNTQDELAEYSEVQNQCLDRILDEYGLIICGWSGEWDQALRDAIFRQKSRRYSTYWVSYDDNLSDSAEKIVKHRDAQLIKNVDADHFFSDLEEMVSALSRRDSIHPESLNVAIARTKRLIENDRLIRLSDLIRESYRQVVERLSSENFLDTINRKDRYSTNQEEVFELYYEKVKLLLGISAPIYLYADVSQSKQVDDLFPSLSQVNGYRISAIIPCLFLFYACGIASISGNRWKNLHYLFYDVSFARPNESSYSTALVSLGKAIDDIYFVPHSDQLLSNILEELFTDLSLSIDSYKFKFDLFQMILSLCYLKETRDDRLLNLYLAVEDRSWHRMKKFWKDAGREGDDHLLISTGFFDGKEELHTLLKSFVEKIWWKKRPRFPDLAYEYAPELGESQYP